MRRIEFLLFALLAVQLVSAQGNLVQNSGFEIHDSCPNLPGQIANFPPWYDPTNASADGFETCGTGYAHLPDNPVGFLNANNGSGCAGFIPFHGGNPGFREYIQSALIDTLEPQRTYCVGFYISPGDSLMYSCDAVGAYFSNQPISACVGCGINVTPQMSSIPYDYISDTTTWKYIQGTFTSQGNERYITIGNFLPDSQTHRITINANSQINSVFFFVDDIEVFKQANAIAGNNVNICLNDSVQSGIFSSDSGLVYRWFPSTGLSDSTVAQPWAKPTSTTTYTLTISDPTGLYCIGNSTDSITVTVNDCTPPPPSPAFSIPTLLTGNELFYITSLPMNANLELYDSRGRLVYKENNYQNNFNSDQLVAGVYLYHLSFPDGTFMKGKICKVK